MNRSAPAVGDQPVSSPETARPRPQWTTGRVAFGLLVLVVMALGAAVWRPGLSPAEREARAWLQEFRQLRHQDGDRRLPDWRLSSAGQQVLVNQLVKPESKLARA